MYKKNTRKKEVKIMMKHISKMCTVLFVLYLMIAPFSGVLADTDHITVSPDAPTSVSYLKTGQLYLLPLTDMFIDSSGHQLSYSAPGADLIGPFVGIRYPNGVPTLVFTVANAGTYYVTVCADCSTNNEHAEFTITFTVASAPNGTPSQYSYDETAQDTVRVYVTISNDGMPIQGSDGTVIANLPVDVPYFDLEDYGLEDYYRYITDGGSGEYISSDEEDIVERPTVLHLYLYLLDRYYSSAYDIYYMGDDMTNPNIDPAYANASNSAINISGYPTSAYLTSFWGHDCNLMYFRNHVFPLMSSGWGATCDYVLLSDGDVIDVAMFTDWGFYSNGAFLRFAGYEYDKYASCTMSRGQTLTVNTQKYSTNSMGGYTTFNNTTEGLSVDIYKDDGTYYDSFTWVNNSGNQYTYTLPNDMPTGIYYVVAKDPSARTAYACMAPAVLTVIVN